MPEYLAPGVFVEERSFRSKSIEGVSTTTTGFIGPARFGPVTEPSDVITGLTEFETAFGDGERLSFGTGTPVVGQNYLWQAARSFFEEGGKRLYVSRVFRPLKGPYPPADLKASVNPDATTKFYDDGHGRLGIGPVGGSKSFSAIARYPGAAGNLILSFTLKLGPNVLGALSDPNAPNDPEKFKPTITNLKDGDVVWISSALAFPNPTVTSPPSARNVNTLPIYVAKRSVLGEWRFSADGLVPVGSPSGADLGLGEFKLNSKPGTGDSIRPLTLSLEILSSDGSHSLGVWSGIPLAPIHNSGGLPDSLFDLFALDTPGNPPLVLVNNKLDNGKDLIAALDAVPGIDFVLTPAEWNDLGHKDELIGLRKKLERGITGTALLDGGNDGLLPGRTEYEGKDDPAEDYATGLKQFESIEDISIVAAPGSTWNYLSRVDDSNAIVNLLIGHAERMKYRIAVIDPPEAQTIADVRKQRAKIDSKYAALYYPWVTVFDPITRVPLNLPPSGFVAGIYARNDIDRAVYKAPANEVVRGAIGFETLINTAQQEVLNPEGINCFRFFEGRGFRLWGARTISSDPEWKYVNIRRYFAYLERSIDKGTQWAVFEPNGEALWANVRATIRDFLINEWANGALLGDKPEKAFFVRCDRSTMTQNDLDNGRLICLIGVAPLKPAEFVIFRIGQWTADRQS